MAQDKGMFRMYFSYTLLKQLDLFPCFFEYAAVFVNGDPQGLYLMIERPVDAIRRINPDAVSISRGGVLWDIKYQGTQPDALALLRRFEAAHTIRDNKARQNEYEKILDLDLYLQWLAFNSMVRNSDSQKEYYGYETRLQKNAYGILKLMAWDYDGIMAPPAHPEKHLNDELLYACADPIDYFIKENKILYDRYKSILNNLLNNQMPLNHLLASIEKIHKKLDSIDTGFSISTQEMQKFERQRTIKTFKKELTDRHERLIESLSK